MATLTRSLTVPTPLDRVAGYLCDLTTTAEWDPHTVRCRRLDDGPVAVGSRYEHSRAFHGYEVTIEMEVVELVARTRIAWQGSNEYAAGREELQFAPDADSGGTVVTHTVDVTLRGVAQLGNVMLPSVLSRIADDGTETMRTALLQLTDQPDGR